jgi:hypothetical protein
MKEALNTLGLCIMLVLSSCNPDKKPADIVNDQDSGVKQQPADRTKVDTMTNDPALYQDSIPH